MDLVSFQQSFCKRPDTTHFAPHQDSEHRLLLEAQLHRNNMVKRQKLSHQPPIPSEGARNSDFTVQEFGTQATNQVQQKLWRNGIEHNTVAVPPTRTAGLLDLLQAITSGNHSCALPYPLPHAAAAKGTPELASSSRPGTQLVYPGGNKQPELFDSAQCTQLGAAREGNLQAECQPGFAGFESRSLLRHFTEGRGPQRVCLANTPIKAEPTTAQTLIESPIIISSLASRELLEGLLNIKSQLAAQQRWNMLVSEELNLTQRKLREAERMQGLVEERAQMLWIALQQQQQQMRAPQECNKVPLEGSGENEAPVLDAALSDSESFSTPYRQIPGSCRLCGERKATVLLVPCRHLALCRECENKAEQCPCCHAQLEAALHIREG